MPPSTGVVKCLPGNITTHQGAINLNHSLNWTHCGPVEGSGSRSNSVATRTVPVVAMPTPTAFVKPPERFGLQGQPGHHSHPGPQAYFHPKYNARPTPTAEPNLRPDGYLHPAPTPAPQPRRRALEERWADCQGEHCPQTDVVWVDKVKTVEQQKPNPATCHTLTKTSTFWQTELHQWITTTYPFVTTEWVYEPTPIVHTALKTTYIETVHHAKPTGSPHCGHSCEDGGNPDDGASWDDWWHWHHPHLSLIPTLTAAQIVTVVLIPIFLVFDLFVWPIHVLALIFLFPFQMYTNLVHEIFHLSAGVLGGAIICSVTIDPGCGPMSFMRNGKPLFTLLMGYIGSQIIGGFYVCLAFDERASKITYLIHAPLWPAVFWFTVGVWPKIQVLLVVGASIALWFIWEARLLRFYMLFIGLLSLYYVLWDVVDDFFFHKENESDASILARIVPSVKAGVWAVIFLFTASGVLTCAIIAGLHFFCGDIHSPSQHFLPT